MRLLIVTQYFWPENFRINDLVAEMVRRGHQVTVLTGYPNYPDGIIFPEFRSRPDSYVQYEGADIIRVPLFPRGRGGGRLILNYISFALSGAFWGPWKLRGRKFDAIFVYEPSPITVGIPAVVMRMLKGAPVAFWVLDLWPETLRAVGVIRSPLMLKMVGKLVAFIYAKCDLILAQSRSFILHINRYCSAGERIVYFPSWSESTFDLENVTPAAEVPLKAGAFNVMFAGNLGDAQDFPTILNAAEHLKEHKQIRWLIVGNGRMAVWISEEIARRDLQDSVLMLGSYPVERMPSFYTHADALLVSLKDEEIFSMTIPGKLQSYLAAGLPIVAMLNGEGADVVRSAAAGITCAAGDARGLASAVLKLASMSDKQRAELGRNGLAVSAREFDRDRLISRLESMLESLKTRRPTPDAVEGNL